MATSDVLLYKNGSTTQRSSTNGYALLDTDGIDFDGLTGIHGFSVDLSDNTDSGFYADGSFYWVVVSSITADSQTVSFVAATFRIRAAEATAGYPSVTVKPGTGTGEINLSSGVVPANVTQFGGTNGTFASGRPEVNTTHIAGSSVSTSSAQIGVNVVNADGTAWNSGAITGNTLAANCISDDQLHVNAANEIRNAVTGGAYALSTDANGRVRIVDGTGAGELDTSSGKVSIVSADISAIQSGLATAADLATVDTVVDAIKVTTDKLDDTLEDDAGTYRFTANALEQAPSGGGGGGATAQEVWEYDISSISTANQAATVLQARASQASVDTVDSVADAIKLKTDNLPGDPADASDIAASFSTVNSTLATMAGYIDTEVASILSAVDTEVAAIKAKTDNLPASPAATGDAMTLTSGERTSVADALLDRSAGVETGITPRQGLRLMLAAMVGKLSGAATTTVTVRDTADSKNRITATVDASGNRSAVTLDAS